MKKETLIAIISQKTGLTKKDSSKAVEAFLSSIVETLASGDKLQITGFGSFEVKDCGPRECRNPQTGEQINVPAKKKPVFKAGKMFKDAVNGTV